MLDISRKAYYPKTTMTNGFALKSEFKKPKKTARRVFALINPELLQNCFLDWSGQIVRQTEGEVIAIDGKQSKGSYDRNQKKSALHVVSAWATENRLMLGQVKVKDKSNEITAIPALLKLLNLTGNIFVKGIVLRTLLS